MNGRFLSLRLLTMLTYLLIIAPMPSTQIIMNSKARYLESMNPQRILPAQVSDGLSAAEWDAIQIQMRQAGYQGNHLTANSANEFFGISVSLSGDTLAVGAEGDSPNGNLDQGSVYIFDRNQGGVNAWGLVKKLTASDGAAGDSFGTVSLSGNTLVVGAFFNEMLGAAYVFYRDQGGVGNWGEVKKIIASDGAGGDFGVSVAVSGDTIVVGAPFAGNGAAYVYSRNLGGIDQWGEVKKLTASDIGVSDEFGWSVSIDDNTILVGSKDATISGNLTQGAAYIFYKDQGGADNWGEVKKLTASDGATGDNFGRSVSVNGNTSVIGSYRIDVGGNIDQGAAYVFSRNQGGVDNWGQVKKLIASDGAENDRFGVDVAVSGGAIVVGATRVDIGLNIDQGAAYIFYQNQGGVNNWGEVKKLTASGGAASDVFGTSVSLDGDTIVIGAPNVDVGFNFDQGAAYVFYRNQGGAEYWGEILRITPTVWLEGDVFKLTASDGVASNNFGMSVSVSGDIVVVGADRCMPGAYVFYRNQGGVNNWGEVKPLTPSDQGACDRFGRSVSVSGDIVVVGAIGSNDDQGAAYVFYRNQGGTDNWGEVKKLTASDGSPLGRFGTSAAIHGDILVIGAPGRGDLGVIGAAYVFYRNQGGTDNWGEVKKITASDGAADDFFGFSVAVDGSTIVVGASLADIGANSEQGAAYVFNRNQGGPENWGEVKKLVASDGAGADSYGVSVSIDGDTIVVGAYTASSEQGAAYIYDRSLGGVDNWGEVKKVTASDGAGGDLFGRSVMVSGDMLLVGAIGVDVFGNVSQGAAYVFRRNQGGTDNWGEVQKLIAQDGATDDDFGRAVSLNGNILLVGDPLADVGENPDRGAAYLYAFQTTPAKVFLPLLTAASP